MIRYNLTDHKGADMESRFFINGKRVSREQYEHIEQMGYSHGHVECFYTKGKALAGGKTRRINYKTVTITLAEKKEYFGDHIKERVE